MLISQGARIVKIEEDLIAPYSPATVSPYDPRIHSLLPFHDRLAAFKDGSDTPRAYLERCLAVIDVLDGEIKAFAALNIEGASAAADASTVDIRNVE